MAEKADAILSNIFSRVLSLLAFLAPVGVVEQLLLPLLYNSSWRLCPQHT